MNILFVPRQREDLKCNKIGMYYNVETMDRVDLCDIETALTNKEEVHITHAPQKVINALVAAFFPQPFIGITDDNNEDFTA